MKWLSFQKYSGRPQGSDNMCLCASVCMYKHLYMRNMGIYIINTYISIFLNIHIYLLIN